MVFQTIKKAISNNFRFLPMIVSAIAIPLTMVFSSPLSAQIYPAFSTPAIPDTSLTVQQGVGAASVPNSVDGTVVMSVFVNTDDVLTYGISTSGTNSVGNGLAKSSGGVYYNPNCNASTPATCSAAIRVYNGKIYIAFSDLNNSNRLTVIVATPISGTTAYSFATVRQDTVATMVTAPEMEVINGLLVIVYGASNDPNTKHAFYEVTFNGTTWTNASESNLGGSSLLVSSAAKPAMAVLGTKLWMVTQQNNSNHQLFSYYTTDGVHWTFGVQDTGLALGGGASMVTYKNTLVLANQQNNSNHALFVFSSTDGVHWGAQEYSAIQMGGVPALALFNTGVALAFKSNNSENYLSSYATQ